MNKKHIIFISIVVFMFTLFINNDVDAKEVKIDYKDYLSSISNSNLRDNYYVQTPNNTDVLVVINQELSSYTIDMINQGVDADYPYATRIDSASAIYNCHSYAWYKMANNNTYWMNDPSSYYLDYSYSISTGSIGDIVCYLDSQGNNIHSGIIIGLNNQSSNNICGDVNTKIIESKWGSCGVYQHDGDYCPYVDSGDAVSVVYYSVNHTHSNSYINYDSRDHLETCSICGYVRHKHHEWSLV